MTKDLTMLGWNLGDPTPDMIARRAAEIREQWSDREHASRAGIYANRRPFTTPTCRLHAELNHSRTMDTI